MATSHTIIDSPVGDLTLVAEEGALTGVYFPKHTHPTDSGRFGPRVRVGFEDATEQLRQYFQRERTEFDLPLAPRGSAFQQRVWKLLCEIPYGETRSYGQLAKELGNPLLAREVGSANGRNPISIIVPCHRVIGANGKLVGYGGGLERKQFLLDLEAPATAAQLRIGGMAW